MAAAVDLVLPGARSAAEVHEDVDLFELPLPEELWEDLDRELDGA